MSLKRNELRQDRHTQNRMQGSLRTKSRRGRAPQKGGKWEEMMKMTLSIFYCSFVFVLSCRENARRRDKTHWHTNPYHKPHTLPQSPPSQLHLMAIRNRADRMEKDWEIPTNRGRKGQMDAFFFFFSFFSACPLPYTHPFVLSGRYVASCFYSTSFFFCLFLSSLFLRRACQCVCVVLRRWCITQPRQVEQTETFFLASYVQSYRRKQSREG